MTLPCDGIGPEIMAAILEVVETASKKFNLGDSFHEEDSGFESLKKHGVTLREEDLDRAR
ncbi:MAG: isocitrate/isopropylmalate family dehydrogenase [Gammaproteobacteria bacterium]